MAVRCYNQRDSGCMAGATTTWKRGRYECRSTRARVFSNVASRGTSVSCDAATQLALWRGIVGI